MSKTKYINTKRINYAKAIKRFFLLIPIIVYIVTILSYFYNPINEFKFIPFKYFWFLNIYYTFYLTFKYSIIPYIIVSVILKNYKADVKFNTVEDFEYYREKLNKLNANDISVLTDLRLEKEKDITGNIMQFELMGYLTLDNGNYVVNDSYLQDHSLSEADRFFLDNFESISKNNYLRIADWHNIIMRESQEKGFITTGGISNTSKTKFVFRFAVILLIASVFFLIISGGFKTLYNASLSLADDGKIVVTSDNNLYTRFFNYHPKMGIYVAFLLNACVSLVILNAYPGIWVYSKIASSITKSKYKRTERGNRYTEYIYGMKNFIHDFSNLSDYDKQGLVLWDKYLIYAVMLEENDKIIDEIKEYRKKIKTTI